MLTVKSRRLMHAVLSALAASWAISLSVLAIADPPRPGPDTIG